jgi:hypothetical protein
MATNIPLTEQFQKIVDAILDPEKRRKIIIRAAAELHDIASGYPVEGAWNKAPGTKGNGVWYQRNFGTRYTRKDGTTGGRNTSQQLQKNWHIERQGESASVWTAVTYAPFLLDANRRVSWAAGHGWLTTDQIAEDYMPRLEEIVIDEIVK